MFLFQESKTVKQNGEMKQNWVGIVFFFNIYYYNNFAKDNFFADRQPKLSVQEDLKKQIEDFESNLDKNCRIRSPEMASGEYLDKIRQRRMVFRWIFN